jgi:hypothetical protein
LAETAVCRKITGSIGVSRQLFWIDARMATLLVLGSKPAPALPPPGAFDALACANGSGRSAAAAGLPEPVFTVMSTVLTSGHKPANDLALEAIRGLRTGTLYLYPRPEPTGHPLERMVRAIKRYNVQPRYFKWRLDALGYHYETVVAWPRRAYHELALGLCGDDPAIAAVIAKKQPSTGIMALVIGMADPRFDRFVMSGFSFEITHAYAHNPLIDQLGTTRSKHLETDVAVLRRLAERHGTVFTTEYAVHEAAGIPLLEPLPDHAAAGNDRVTERLDEDRLLT